MKTIIERFEIKSVEPIRLTSELEREAILKRACYNMFLIRVEDVLIDLLTDGGTAAMSASQWAGIMQGDESYAGTTSFYRFESKVKELTGFKHIILTHRDVPFSGAEAVDLPTREGKDPELIADFKCTSMSKL